MTESHYAGTDVWQVVSSCMLFFNQILQSWERESEKKNLRKKRVRRVGGREGKNRLGSPQWWISSEACFITRLPVWRSAGKSRPCGAAAEIYGSLIISTNTLQYSIVQYTAPAALPNCPIPGPCTLSTLLLQVLWLQVCDHKSPTANAAFIAM